MILDEYDRLSAASFLGTRKLKQAKSAKAVEYQEYMRSKAWRHFRAGVIAKRGEMCERCGIGTKFLEVHHLSYTNLGRELEDDVLLLCHDCHMKRHRV